MARAMVINDDLQPGRVGMVTALSYRTPEEKRKFLLRTNNKNKKTNDFDVDNYCEENNDSCNDNSDISNNDKTETTTTTKTTTKLQQR